MKVIYDCYNKLTMAQNGGDYIPDGMETTMAMREKDKESD